MAEISSDMTHTAAPVKVLLGNRRAQAVLVWLTDLGDAGGRLPYRRSSARPRSAAEAVGRGGQRLMGGPLPDPGVAPPTSPNAGAADSGAAPAPPRDWAAQTADTFDELLGPVRSKTTVPLERLTRVLVYGIIAAILAVVVVVLAIIALVRALDELIPGPVWSVYLLLGGIFIALGLFLWRKRPSRQDG